eukprot:g6964.t1
MAQPPSPYGPVPEQDSGGCHLISENYAYALQLILGFAALAGLVFKRWRAPVKRDLMVWMFDVSKQGFGAMFIHVWNILLSIHEGGAKPGSDECAMYFVNFSLDIAIGTFMIWCFVRVQELTAVRFGVDSLKVTGDYGTPPRFSVYRTQLLAYTVILVICKAVTTVIVIAMDEVLSSLANALFSPVSSYPELELTLVMIICPWILNALQFWILDNVLMSERVIPDMRPGSFGKYEPAAESDAGGGGTGIDSGLDASERDGLNTPTGLPSEPSWMSEPVLGEGGSGGAGGALGWRGGRRERGDGSGTPERLALGCSGRGGGGGAGGGSGGVRGGGGGGGRGGDGLGRGGGGGGGSPLGTNAFDSYHTRYVSGFWK